MSNIFKVVSLFAPRGDQPQAIEKLTGGLQKKYQFQTLLGVTGSGKTYTMAKVIENMQVPTLVIAHNKTLAAQLCSEFKHFFPENKVEYFVSYYDYYQPEAYLPHSDTYIEKDSSINEEIDRLRHSTTQSLLTRKDVIVVASVSCIYNIGSPSSYSGVCLKIKSGEELSPRALSRSLVNIYYERGDFELKRGTFRLRGDTCQIYPPYQNVIVQVEFSGNTVEKLSHIATDGKKINTTISEVLIFPARHYIAQLTCQDIIFSAIYEELRERITFFKKCGKELEAQRLYQRTKYDIELIKELGYCSGIENYSRYFDGRAPDEFIIFIDESHATLPQIEGMYKGDKARKDNLVNYGFRLPSAYDNRPLKFSEVEEYFHRVVFVSATPAKLERRKSAQIVEQIVRPTGLIDPKIIIKPAKNQIIELIKIIKEKIKDGERILVTTLTKRSSESLVEYLIADGIRARYLHSEVQTLDRIEILRTLRQGKFDVLVGVNLLREGLDLPEVSGVAILDADKEGFLRSTTSLIQTIGRAARNIKGEVFLFADNITRSIHEATEESERRRNIQLQYNKKYSIIPETIRTDIKDILSDIQVADKKSEYHTYYDREFIMADSLEKAIQQLTREMKRAAKDLHFEKAAEIRDEIFDLQKKINAKK